MVVQVQWLARSRGNAGPRFKEFGVKQVGCSHILRWPQNLKKSPIVLKTKYKKKFLQIVWPPQNIQTLS